MRNSTVARSLLAALLIAAGSALAESKVLTLAVPGMTCSACPITVKKALNAVPGVQKVSVTFEPREAVVTFDDKKASVADLQLATKNAGYPSAPKSVAAPAR